MEDFLLDGGAWILIVIFTNTVGLFIFFEKMLYLLQNPTSKSSLSISLYSHGSVDWEQLEIELNRLKGVRKRIFSSILESAKTNQIAKYHRTNALLSQETERFKSGSSFIWLPTLLSLTGILMYSGYLVYQDPHQFLTPQTSELRDSILLAFGFSTTSLLVAVLLTILVGLYISKKIRDLHDFTHNLISLDPPETEAPWKGYASSF